MILGIHQALLRQKTGTIVASILGCLVGGTLTAFGVHTLLAENGGTSFPIYHFVLGGILIILCAKQCYDTVSWLRRATWVLQTMEPVQVLLSTHVRKILAPRLEASIRPMKQQEAADDPVRLRLLYPYGQHSTITQGSTRHLDALVHIDPRSNGPIVIRCDGCVLCSNPYVPRPSLRSLRRRHRHHEHAEASVV